MSNVDREIAEAARLRRFLETIEGVECGCCGKAAHNLESRGGPSDLLTQAGGSHRVMEVRP